MCEENKKFWDESQISAINAWLSSGKSFSQIDEEYNFAVGTLFTIVNAIPDYRGTRSSISKWLRRMTGALIPGSGCRTTKAISSLATPAQTTKKKGMTKKTSPSTRLTDTEQTILDLTRKLNAATRKIEKLEADRKKAELREEFQSGVIAEYKKLVKPAQSKKINYQVAMRLRMSRDLSVSEACGLLGVTKQAWYAFFKRSFKDAIDEDRILECVRSIREDLPALGVRKMKDRLRKEFCLDIGRDRLFDIMNRHNLLIRPRVRRTRTTFSDHGMKVYPDLRKDFAPDDINQLWVSDITYIWLPDQNTFYYLFLITDAYSKKIVGWEIADNMRHENAMTALKMAFRQCRRGQHPIHHSDKGLQYCAKPYVEMLRRRHARISMTEGYDPRNNGIAERVNGILKEEFLKHMDVRKDNIRQVLEDVINTYHTRRPHLSLGMLTPDEVHRGATGRKLWKKYYLKSA